MAGYPYDVPDYASLYPYDVPDYASLYPYDVPDYASLRSSRGVHHMASMTGGQQMGRGSEFELRRQACGRTRAPPPPPPPLID